MAGLFGNELFNLGLGLFGAWSEKQATDAYNRDEKARLNTVLGDLDNLQQRGVKQLGDNFTQQAMDLNLDREGALAAYDSTGRQMLNGYDPLIQGYQDRYTRNMNYLKGAGQQEQADIRQNYANANAAGLQDLTTRGLGNSSLLASMQTGNTREMNADLGRSNERIRGQYINADSALSGDVLNAQATKAAAARDIASNRFNLGQSYAGMTRDLQSNFLSQRWGFDTDMALKHADTLASVQSTPPAQGYAAQLAGGLGRGMGARDYLQTVSTPGGMASWFNAGTGAGLGAGVGAVAGLAAPLVGLPALTATGIGLTAAGGAGIGGVAGLAYGRR